MPGLNIPAAPGFNGWVRLRDGTWKTMKPAEVAEVRAALAKDMAECASCQAGTIVEHATTYIHEAGERDTHVPAAHTYRCRSGSRWFNPATRQMEGRAHCTCPVCWG